MSHTKGKLYVGAQNDMLYLIDRQPSPAPIEFVHEGLEPTTAVAKIYGDYQLASANARRLVTCWNACECLSQETLDGGWKVDGLVKFAHAMESENAALRAEVELLRKDAERYRHIRANFNRLQCVNPSNAPEPDKLDKAIDAELKDTK